VPHIALESPTYGRAGPPTSNNPRGIDDGMQVNTVLVAFDGLAPSQNALDEAADIVRSTKAKLAIICVVRPTIGAYGFEVPAGATTAAMMDSARRMLNETKASLQQKGIPSVETVLLEGDPVERIVEYTSQHTPDLVVVGSRGLSEAGRFFLGSVSDGILHHVHVPILVVKSGPAAAVPKGAATDR
jgi:nucleotide-binding universal stress UspA family protein